MNGSETIGELKISSDLGMSNLEKYFSEFITNSQTQMQIHMIYEEDSFLHI